MISDPQSARPHDTRAHEYDAVVVGARCAGAATAMLLASAGHDVALVDRTTFPSDTLSTHCVARSGVVQLDRWGLLQPLLDAGTPPIRDVVFHADGRTIRRTMQERFGVDMMIAPRRYLLDALLVEAAVDAGATLITGATVNGVRRDSTGRVDGVLWHDDRRQGDIRARLVIGADGRRSRIARAVAAPFTEIRDAVSGSAHYAYFAGDWPEMEYFIGRDSFAGIFPTNNAEACIWVCCPTPAGERLRREHMSIEDAFVAMQEAVSPELAERLRTTAIRTSPVHGVLTLPNHLRRPFGPGWALVGDAGYHRDPITGHGISDAFRDAELVARAADLFLHGQMGEAEAMAGYENARDEQLRTIFEITCELVSFPDTRRFLELQKALGMAIDAQAEILAAQPSLPLSDAA